MNKQEKDLRKLLLDLRNEGRELTSELVTLHENLCARAVEDSERLNRARADLARLEALEAAGVVEGTYELQLNNSELSATERKKIKALGGSFRECRGYMAKRIVFLPAGCEELAALLLERSNTFGVLEGARRSVTVVFRPIDGVVSRNTWSAKELGDLMKKHSATMLARRIRDAKKALAWAEAEM